MPLQLHLPLTGGKTEAQRAPGAGPRSPGGQFQNGDPVGLQTLIFFKPYHNASQVLLTRGGFGKSVVWGGGVQKKCLC